MSDRPCVIFVHGIKGGHLRNQQNKKIWLRVVDLFSNHDTGLALPIDWENGSQKKDGTKSDGPIKKILWKPVYAPFLSGMKKKGWQIFNFKHDWRRDQLEIASELIEYIQQINAPEPANPNKNSLSASEVSKNPPKKNNIQTIIPDLQ